MKKVKEKKIVFIVLLLFITQLALTAEWGDVNSSGGIDIVDALLVAQYYVGLNPQDFDQSVADVDGDSAINIVDALLIAQLYVGLINEFPVSTETQAPTPVPTPEPTPETGLQTGTVRVFWLIPSDVPYDQRIVDGISNVMREVQRYYYNELGKTFHLNNPVVEVCYGDNTKDWYETYPVHSDPYWYPVDNMAVELIRKYGLTQPDPRWIIVGYISADGHGGSDLNGWVYLPKHDADGAGGLRPEGMNRWYGGMAHELGHAFRYPDSSYTDGTPMSASFYDYPNCHFNETQKNAILTHPQNQDFLYTEY